MCIRDRDWNEIDADDFLVIDCSAAIDPVDFTRVYNDPFLKYKVTQADIDRGKAKAATGETGITSTSASATIDGSAVQFDYYENSNYLQIPPNIIGVEKIFTFDSSQGLSMTNMFSFKYQLALNDMYNWGRFELLGYTMAMSR